MIIGDLYFWRCTFGVDGAAVLSIEHIEDLFDFEDICGGESRFFVGFGIEFRFLRLCFFCSAHIL